MTLLSRLTREPRELAFGTSGRRGRLADLTQLEIYLNVTGELEWLLALDPEQGGIAAGDEFYLAHDLRPSSPVLAQAVDRAVRDAGLRPVHLGAIPTPALANYAWKRAKGSIMVTGSHIPFDWNGYKLNTSRGELLKTQEPPIQERVLATRRRFYGEPFESSAFDAEGRLREAAELPKASCAARDEYFGRYTEFFTGRPLDGLRVVCYQHSAVGRDLLPELLEALGATVARVGRSETFVPIDTEAIDAATVESIARLLPHGAFDAVVSTDGDSDRPLLLGVNGRELQFFPGDLVGMVVAEFLGADAVVVPVSCNDAIDRGALAGVLEPKTRIGSPYVVAGMQAAAASGRAAVCGWEANGGFLVGSDIVRRGRTLRALATRDAMLPILATLAASRERGVSLGELFDALPARFTSATLLREFPRTLGRQLMERLAPEELEPLFGGIARADRTDGLRVSFASGDVVHLRPSGNADEFRVYSCADSPRRAQELAARASDWLRSRGLQ